MHTVQASYSSARNDCGVCKKNKNAHCSFVHKSPKLITDNLNTHQQNRQILLATYNGIPVSNLKKKVTATYNMDESHKNN